MSAIYSGAFLEFRPAARSRTFSELHGIDRATTIRAIAGVRTARQLEICSEPETKKKE